MLASTHRRWGSRCERQRGPPLDSLRRFRHWRVDNRQVVKATRMPEGDAIFRTARTLHRALAGKEVTAFESVFPSLNRVNDDAPIAGRTIDRVHSTGKHLLMHF